MDNSLNTNTTADHNDSKRVTPEELDRAPFVVGEDPDSSRPEEGQLSNDDNSNGGQPRSNNIDRTFLNIDEEEEDEQEASLTDEEDWVEDEYTDDENDPILTEGSLDGDADLLDELDDDIDEPEVDLEEDAEDTE